MEQPIGNASAHEALVDALFAGVLGRAPRPPERERWAALARQRTALELLTRLMDSKEFKQRRRVETTHPNGHYYSPVVDPATVDPAQLRSDLSPEELAAVGISLEEMDAFWARHREQILSARFRQTDMPSRRYHPGMGFFCEADALILRAMILVHRPRRIVEIGCGVSSMVMLDALEDAGLDQTTLTFIDPYPERLLGLMRPEDQQRSTVLAERVQDVDLAPFDALEADDILFIDSSHVLKTQSDVSHEFFKVLPRLRRGVVVHVHDIFYPFEYPENWILKLNRSWNEAYALRLFLTDNPNWRVRFFNSMFGSKRREMLARECPAFARQHGGSIWLQRV